MTNTSTHSRLTALTLLTGALFTVCSAQGAENRAQRYTPGLGGSDMTSMLVPGWYGQVAMVHYHATKLKGNDGNDAVQTGTITSAELAANPRTAALAPAFPQGIGYTSAISHFRTDAYVMQPRITYLSSTRFLGAHLGFTAMVPVMERQTAISGLTTLSTAATTRLAGIGQAAAGPLIAGSVDAKIVARSYSNAGVGDIEMAPVLNWEIGDHQTATLAATIVLPTGEYDKAKPVNPGFGRFYTFRPSLQYGYIADGWDVGARTVLSFNTRNKDTQYRSGTMLNLDFALMKFVSEDVRLGLQGYVVQQLTGDSSDIAADQLAIDAANGNKMRAYAMGPALAWLKNGGEMLMEGKILREFGARNRAEGTTYLLTISKPFGL